MFAVTDYKLQGQTLDKLILSLGDRTFSPPLTLQKLYVLVSRVRAAKDIRLLSPQDPGGFEYIKDLQQAPALHVWDNAYNDARRYDDSLAQAAWDEYEARRTDAPAPRRNDAPAPDRKRKEPDEGVYDPCIHF